MADGFDVRRINFVKTLRFDPCSRQIGVASITMAFRKEGRGNALISPRRPLRFTRAVLLQMAPACLR